MLPFTLALLTVVLAGRVLDRTTGQPLAHVVVASDATHRATTDAAGRFALRGLRGSRVTVTLESDDVPAQRVTVPLRARGTTRHDLHACSTTLDYNCGAQTPTGTGAAASAAG